MMMIVLLNFDFSYLFWSSIFIIELVVVVDVDGAVSIDIGDCKFKLYS